MSSHRKNFRRRTDDAEDAYGDDSSNSKPTATKTQTPPVPKPRSPRRQGASRLSFVEDEDDDDAEEGPLSQRRRPAATVRQARTASPAAATLHRLTPARDRLKSSPAVAAAVPAPKPSNFQSHAGEYTPERLRELQKNARPLPGSLMRAPPPPPPPTAEAPRQRLPGAAASPAPATNTTAAAVEPVVILKGLVKPMSQASIGPRNPSQNEDKDEDESEEEEEEEEGPVIPDRATIEAIRAKRQQLQQPRHAAPDYISLDGGGVLSSREAAGGSSDEDDDETRGRIAMYAEKSDSQRSTKGVFGVINNRGPAASLGVINDGFREVEDEKDDDEDEEERKWEEEQFRKGLGRRVDDASAQRAANGGPAPVQVQPQPSGYSIDPRYQPSFSGVLPGTSIFASGSAEFLSIAQQADVASKALQENIRKLKETHKTTVDALVKTDTHLTEALSEISSLESGLQDAERKFVYMQELRNYISVMCDFLNDKAFYIEELEEHMQKLHENRVTAVSERRAADLADESSVIEAAVNAAVSVLSKGSSSAYLSAASNAAQAAAAAARESSNLPPELDEFGRDINMQKRMDLKRREEDRRRRKIRSESKRLSSEGRSANNEHIEGELSTDESDSESSAYLSSRDELLKTADLVFSDAAEEYSSLRIVKDKFEGWKTQYPLAYRDAHVALSAPSVFTPYVRLELLKWDPLHETTDFFGMEWHKILFDYGEQNSESGTDPNNVDKDLIPVLVEKVALPILHHRIMHCWDILSTQRTKNAVDAINMVISYLPTSSKALHQLLATVNSRLTEAIADISVPAWGSMVTRTVPGASQYAAHRFGVAIRLLKNVCLWKDIFAKPVLEKLALEELLKGKILPHMKSIILDAHDAIARAERISALLKGVWSSPSQKLQPFIDLVVELGNKLERRHMSGISEEETRGLARRLKDILVELNEYDKARAILKTFQIREAL